MLVGHIAFEQLIDSKKMPYDLFLENRRAFTIGYNSTSGEKYFPQSVKLLEQLLTPQKRALLDAGFQNVGDFCPSPY